MARPAPKWLRWCWIGALLFALAPLYRCACHAASALRLVLAGESDPRLVAQVLDRDFGPVAPGGALRAAFPVSNLGGRRLILRQVDGSCACSLVARHEVILAPGADRELPFEFLAPSAAGSYRFEFRYRTNDPHEPALAFTVTFRVNEPG